MSIGKNSIDCILSGTIGDKVWVNRNGKNYERSKPSAFSKPKTATQLEHMAKFATLVKFFKPFTLFLRVGFKSHSANMSAFNAAISCNYHHAFNGTYPEYEVDYSKVQVSRGPLPGALNPGVKLTAIGEIEFTWKNNSIAKGAMGNDKVLLVVYNSGKQEAEFKVGGNTRIMGSQVMALPATFAGDEVHCYITFQDTGQSVVSNSQFIGKIQLPHS